MISPCALLPPIVNISNHATACWLILSTYSFNCSFTVLRSLSDCSASIGQKLAVRWRSVTPVWTRSAVWGHLLKLGHNISPVFRRHTTTTTTFSRSLSVVWSFEMSGLAWMRSPQLRCHPLLTRRRMFFFFFSLSPCLPLWSLLFWRQCEPRWTWQHGYKSRAEKAATLVLQCSSCFALKIPEETEMRAALSLAPITLLQLTFLTALHGRSSSVTYRGDSSHSDQKCSNSCFWRGKHAKFWNDAISGVSGLKWHLLSAVPGAKWTYNGESFCVYPDGW